MSNLMQYKKSLSIIAVTLLVAGTAGAQQSGHVMHNPMHQPESSDERQLVHYPEQMKSHTLMNMRDHLVTLQKIQLYLANGQYDQAAEIAEQRLGMSAMELHGAKEASQFMPEGMQLAGTTMHHGASRFAQVAINASVTDDLNAALNALAEVTASCIACHNGYRLQ